MKALVFKVYYGFRNIARRPKDMLRLMDYAIC